jgi:GTP-dependent dephospho-CoA kinase
VAVKVLPENLRDELKNPIGKLYKGNGLECIRAMEKDLRQASKVAAVGDMTAYYLLEGRVVPDLLIVDMKTKRMPVSSDVLKGLEHDSYRVVKVDNPPATLTDELIDAIRSSLAGMDKVKITVRGEEDLAMLPVIFYAPIGSAVVYGQPNEGSVLVKVTPEKKDQIKNLMNRMDVK